MKRTLNLALTPRQPIVFTARYLGKRFASAVNIATLRDPNPSAVAISDLRLQSRSFGELARLKTTVRQLGCQLSLLLVDESLQFKKPAISRSCRSAIQIFLENVNKASLKARDVGIKNSYANSAVYLKFIESYRNGTGLAHWIWKRF